MLIRKKDFKKFLLARIKEKRPAWECTRISPKFIQLAEVKVHQFIIDFVNGNCDSKVDNDYPNILYNTRVRQKFANKIMGKYPVITKIFISKYLTPLVTQQLIKWLDYKIHSHRTKGKTFNP